MRFYERFCSFRALSIIGKCTSRHLFAYGGLRHTKPQRQRAQKQFNLAGKLNVSAVLPSTVVKKMSVLPRALLD